MLQHQEVMHRREISQTNSPRLRIGLLIQLEEGLAYIYAFLRVTGEVLSLLSSLRVTGVNSVI